MHTKLLACLWVCHKLHSTQCVAAHPHARPPPRTPLCGQMVSIEVWSPVMYATMSATKREMQPIRNSNNTMALFWILFMVVGSFTLLALIVGVSIGKVRLPSSGPCRQRTLAGIDGAWLCPCYSGLCWHEHVGKHVVLL